MDKKGAEKENQFYGLEAYTDFGNRLIFVKNSQLEISWK
jgi:hypothetical protein